VVSTAYSTRGLDVPRLCRAIEHGRKVLEPFRELHRDLSAEVAGPLYGAMKDDLSVPLKPVNLLYNYAQLLHRILIPKNPRALFATAAAEHMPTVDGLMQWCNDEAARTYLGDEVARCVVDALATIGIMQVAIADPAMAEKSGYSELAGRPCAKRISPDDFVFDGYAKDLREAGFVGHRYRVPYDAVMSDKSYDAKARSKLQPNEFDENNRGGDLKTQSLMVSGHGYSPEDEYKDHVDLWQIYVPAQKQIIILSDDQVEGEGGEPLLVRQWVGPDCGPYHYLGFLWLGDLPMPVSPMMHLYPLHTLANNLYRKLADQAERQKTITAVDEAAVEDGEKVRDTGDGEIAAVRNIDRVKQMTYGGPDPANQAFMMQVMQEFSKLGGNLEVLGGTQQQAKTLGQEKILNQNSGRVVTDMTERVSGLVAEVFRALGWFQHKHPSEVYSVTKRVQGTTETLPRKIYPAKRFWDSENPAYQNVDPTRALTRDLPFEAMKIDIDPYSMQFTTPAEKSQFLVQMVTQVFAPMMPLLEKQGIQLDANALVDIIADYNDTPEMRRILSIVEPVADMEGQGDPGGVGMPAATSRSYERVSRSEATPQGQNTAVMQALMGQNPGGSPQTAGMGGQPRGPY
jgi:hypothetical protein